jgi:hypothetical protein
LTGQPPDDYDVSGDGVVNRLDAEVVIYNLLHTERLWQNPSNRWDVSGDGYVVASDVLIITNYVNAHGSRLLDQPRASGDYWLDVSGDNVVSRLDADQVTSKINTGNGNITTARRNGWVAVGSPGVRVGDPCDCCQVNH